jgi:coenzyme F420-reducing hydrogenase delta subunit
MQRDAETGGWTPEIVLLYCQRGSREEADVALACEAAAGCAVRPVLLPCSSKTEAAHVLKLLEAGADGVELVACPEGACRLLDGNVRAEKRMEVARRLLDRIGMGAGRLGVSRGEGLSAGDLIGRAVERARAVKSLGPNPMKRTAPDRGVKGGPR